jgi:hypothetical protein
MEARPCGIYSKAFLFFSFFDMPNVILSLYLVGMIHAILGIASVKLFLSGSHVVL